MTEQNAPPVDAELVELAARGATLCPACEGDGTVADGLDDAAVSMVCPHCLGSAVDIRAVIAAIAPEIRAQGAAEERAKVLSWLLSDGARLDYEASGREEHEFWWATDAIEQGTHDNETE